MNFDGIYNFYEQMVFDEIRQVLQQQPGAYSNDDAEDIACLALNQVPARYVRHSVDTAYYLGDEERLRMHDAVKQAVARALERVKTHPGAPD